MSNVEREAENLESSEALTLNKETLQDLDVPVGDAQDVRGGGLSIVLTSQNCPGIGTRVSEQCQITPYKGEITPYTGGVSV